MRPGSLLFLLLLLALSRAQAALPELAASDYLITTYAGVSFSDRDRDPGKVRVVLTLKWAKRPPKGAYAVAEFSNRKLRGTETVERAVSPSESGFTLESPEYRCVANNSVYVVTVSVYSDKTMSNLLGTHEQKVGVALHPKALEAFRARACG
jgi:hypothetical protein